MRRAIMACAITVVLALPSTATASWSNLVGSRWDRDEAASLAHAIKMPHPRLMGAITQPESGGLPWAKSPTDDHGLWQINAATWRDHGPWGRKGFAWIYGPVHNAYQAKYVLQHHSTGVWAWTTFANRLWPPKGEIKPWVVRKIRAALR